MGAQVRFLIEKGMYDLRLMLESFAFSKLSGTDTQHIIKEMKKQLEMMKRLQSI